MEILVTGGTGFIGRHAVTGFSAAGHGVWTLSRAPRGPADALGHIQHDLAEPLAPVSVPPVAAVVHLAGYGSVDAAMADPAGALRQNAQTALHALEIARQHEASFMLASSQRIYRPRPRPLSEGAVKLPTEPYGYSKLVAELYVEMASRVYGVAGAVLRLFSVYGPGQLIAGGQSGVVAIFANRALAGAELVVMSRDRKDFVEVSDVVQAMTLALARPASPARAYNIGAGRPTSLAALARAVRSAADSTSPIVERFTHDAPGGLVADIRRARRELGYEPRISLQEGLRRYVAWLRATRAHSAQGAPDADPAR